MGKPEIDYLMESDGGPTLQQFICEVKKNKKNLCETGKEENYGKQIYQSLDKGNVTLKILLWGTGGVARSLWLQCQTLNQYELLGLIDNDPKKQGSIFNGLKIYPPTILDTYKPDFIVILSDAYEEIYRQIVESHPEMEGMIANKNFFYGESILKRYKGTKNQEEMEVLDYIKRNGLDVFNYEYSKKYKNLPVETHFDAECGMFYVMESGKRLYFSRKLDNEKKVIDYYRYILMEQDVCSPHRYLTDDFDVCEGDVVIDVGAAEGNFSLQVIDRAAKLYIIETDADWIEALKETFKGYPDKVIMIQKFVSSYDEGDFATLDAFINEPVDFIKMDIEGNEWDALQGAEGIIRRSETIKCAVCCYHSDFDQVLIEDFMDKNGLSHYTSDGFIWFPYTIRQNYVSTRLNRAIVRGEKRGG